MFKLPKDPPNSFYLSIINWVFDKKYVGEVPERWVRPVKYGIVNCSIRQECMLRLKFEKGMPQAEIAVEFGISSERVRQLLERAKIKITKSFSTRAVREAIWRRRNAA